MPMSATETLNFLHTAQAYLQEHGTENTQEFLLAILNEDRRLPLSDKTATMMLDDSTEIYESLGYSSITAEIAIDFVETTEQRCAGRHYLIAIVAGDEMLIAQ